MGKMIFSEQEMVTMVKYPTSHDMQWPNKIVTPEGGGAKKSLALTYTKEKDYRTCPRMFYMKHLTNKFPFIKTPQMEYGDLVHNALEAYALDSKPIPKTLKDTVPTGYVDKILARADKYYTEGQLAEDVFCEQQWAIDPTGRMASWMSSTNVFYRMKVDIGFASKSTIFAFDWKTGNSKYPDEEQLDMYALGASARPTMTMQTKASTGLLFLGDNVFVPHTVSLMPQDREALMRKWLQRSLRIIDSYQRDYWPEKEGFQCAWCEDVTCPFNRYDPERTNKKK